MSVIVLQVLAFYLVGLALMVNAVVVVVAIVERAVLVVADVVVAVVVVVVVVMMIVAVTPVVVVVAYAVVGRSFQNRYRELQIAPQLPKIPGEFRRIDRTGPRSPPTIAP